MTKVIKTTPYSGNDAKLNALIENAIDPVEIDSLMNRLSNVGLVRVLGKFNVTPMLYHVTANELARIDKHLIKAVNYSVADLLGDRWWGMFASKGSNDDGDGDGQREFDLSVKHFAAHPKSRLHDNKDGTFSLKTK
jgi:hypothetical protein